MTRGDGSRLASGGSRVSGGSERAAGTRPLSVLVISPSEAGGGAEMVATDLFRSCRDRGLRMTMIVGRKASDDPDVIELPHDRHRSAWARTWLEIASGFGRQKVRNVGEPVRWLRRFLGREDMDFPASSRLFDLIDEPVDLVHAHNLHGGGGSGFHSCAFVLS